MEQANISQSPLQNIVVATHQIFSCSTFIASAVEEPSVVAAQISKNISPINERINNVAQYGSQASTQSNQVNEIASEINQSLIRLHTNDIELFHEDNTV